MVAQANSRAVPGLGHGRTGSGISWICLSYGGRDPTASKAVYGLDAANEPLHFKGGTWSTQTGRAVLGEELPNGAATVRTDRSARPVAGAGRITLMNLEIPDE